MKPALTAVTLFHFGECPFTKLPYTWPKSIEQVPCSPWAMSYRE